MMKKTVLTLSACLVFVFATSCGYAVEEIDNEPISFASVQNVQINQNVMTNAEMADLLVETAVMPTEELTKDQLYSRCMNTLLYLKQLSGQITVKYTANSPTYFDGKVEYDFTAQKFHTQSESYSVEDTPKLLDEKEVYKEDKVQVQFVDYAEEDEEVKDCYEISDGHIANQYTEKDIYELAEDESISEIPEEILYATNGQDPTGAHQLGGCFVPQEWTMGYLADFSLWEIAGTEKLHGRTCVVVKGNASESYGKQLGVTEFEIWIDQETGIWLWYEGYDENGMVQSYLYTKDMKFDNNADNVCMITEDIFQEKLKNNAYSVSSYSTMSVADLAVQISEFERE